MKEKVKQLKVVRAYLVGIQKYNLENDIEKSRYVSYKISYIDTVIEYLYQGINTKYLGRIDGISYLYSKTGSKIETNLLIEDIKSKDMASHIRYINKIAFNTPCEVTAFTTQPTRLGYALDRSSSIIYTLFASMVKDPGLAEHIQGLLSK